MAKRARICWGIAAGLALVGIWWLMHPRIYRASEASVRAAVAPRWLEPLPHPDGGRERYVAVQRGLEVATGRSPVHASTVISLDLADPEVAGIVDLLGQGAVDSTGNTNYRWSALAAFPAGLTRAAIELAESGDWAGVERQMEAAYLVVGQLHKSSLDSLERNWAMNMESHVHEAVVKLTVRGDLPDATAARLAALVAVDRHDADDLERVLRGDMQTFLLPMMATFQVPGTGESPLWVSAGSYDPLGTAKLFNDLCDQVVLNAGLPLSSWTPELLTVTEARYRPRISWRNSFWAQLTAPDTRIHMAITPNSIGRVLVKESYIGLLPHAALRRLSERDKAAAALAISRFRQQAGRDPHGFDELIAAGLLETVPMVHEIDAPLRFNLKRLAGPWPAGAN